MRRRDFIGAAGALPVLVSTGVATGASKKAPKHASSPAKPPDLNASWIEVDRARLAFNLETTRRKAQGRRIMACIKANAYGHGVVDMGLYLAGAGIDAFLVNAWRECVALREAGVGGMLLNFGPMPSDRREICDLDCSQAVFTDEVEGLAAAAVAARKTAAVHVMVDTGLGRTGIPHHQALPFIEKVSKLRGVKIEGVMTDLSEEPELDKEQLGRFGRLVDDAKAKGIALGLRHCAASTALADRGPEFLLDMVRPGIMLYGHYPTEKTAKDKAYEARPAITWKARVQFVKTLRPGDAVGYHRAFVATVPTTVATLAIGHADGLPHAAVKTGAQVLIGGRRHTFIGVVSANNSVVKVESEGVKVGDEAVIVGEQGGLLASAQDLATRVGSSDYKILIGIGPLAPRVMRG